MLHLLAPTLSETSQPAASAFFEVVAAELGSVTQTTTLTAVDHVIEAVPQGADGVIFFNPPRPDVAQEIEDLLSRAAEAGAVILPIAMSVAERRPPGVVGDRQSFDVVDHRRRRNLSDTQTGTIGRAFAREALSKIQPTYESSHLRLFLCHRREDGEGLAAAIDGSLSVLHEHVFRDLIAVQAGEPAQERIDEALDSADIVVFLDTPMAGDSWWIAHELSGALGRAIPVIWVKLGGSPKTRLALPVPPGPSPHIEHEDLNPSQDVVGDLADAILHKAFEEARVHVRSSNAALRTLQAWARERGATLERLDARRLIFELQHPEQDRPYPTRPATDVVQMFARHPNAEDHERLTSFLTEQEMGPHQRECRSFDAAILLDPTATGRRTVGDWAVVEHPDQFLGSLASPSAEPEDVAEPPRLLLLGAFPSDELAHQEVKAALHAVTSTWLRKGGGLIFGGHPTFTPLVTEVARLVLGERARERVSVYQSEWFVSPSIIDDLQRQITVVPTPRGPDRDSSLTVMRTAMIKPAGAVAAVSIGGRTTEGGAHVPGIDEEIALAKAARLPTYLLGGPGGRTAQLASRERGAMEPWSGLGNALSAEENERFMQSDDYESLVRTIWATHTR